MNIKVRSRIDIVRSNKRNAVTGKSYRKNMIINLIKNNLIKVG